MVFSQCFSLRLHYIQLIIQEEAVLGYVKVYTEDIVSISKNVDLHGQCLLGDATMFDKVVTVTLNFIREYFIIVL